MDNIQKLKIEKMYVHLNMTDKEIAHELNLSRNHITELRRKYSIKPRLTIGREGELILIEKLKSLDFSVKDMNLINKNSPFDVLVDENVRIDVKSSAYSQKERYNFRLLESKRKGLVISETRIRLKNGATKKLYEKTCDYIIFVGMNPNSTNEYWIISPKKLKTELQGIDLPVNHSFKSKYDRFYENWDQLRN